MINEYSTDEFKKGQKVFEVIVIIICTVIITFFVGVYIYLANHVTIGF